MCIRYFYKCFQGKPCSQKFLSINMVFHFIKVKCPFSANIVANSSPPKTTCVRWNFNNRLTFRNIAFGTIYVIIPPRNINYWLWRKIIIASKHPLEILSTFFYLVLSIYSELLYTLLLEDFMLLSQSLLLHI